MTDTAVRARRQEMAKVGAYDKEMGGKMRPLGEKCSFNTFQRLFYFDLHFEGVKIKT